MTKTFASEIDDWRQRGEVIDIHAPVERRFEAAAITAEIQATSNKIAVFHNVRGASMPVATNLYGSRRRLRALVGLQGHGDTLCAAFDRHVQRCLAPSAPFVSWDASAGERHATTLTRLPVLTYHEKDAGPYITTGIIVAKDPETGIHNLSFHRAMLVSDTELRISIGPRHDLAALQRATEEGGRALEVAFLVGVSAGLFLAACTSLPRHSDELALAASIDGAPVAMRKSPVLGLDIPIAAEIVIEGRILANERRPEAPFGEWMGYYVEQKQSHVFEVAGVDCAPEPLFHALVCGSNEDLRPLESATSARIFNVLRRQFDGILDVVCFPTMLCTAIRIRQAYEGHARQVLLAAVTAHFMYSKICIVVDEDVDVHDLSDVMWAYATRARPDERTQVLNNLPGFFRDPHKDHWGRLALDATVPWGRGPEFSRKRIPGRDRVDLASLLREPRHSANTAG